MRDKTQDGIVDVKEFQIYRRNAVLAGQYRGNRIIRDQPEFDEVVAETSAVLSLIVECLTEMLRTNQVLANENFAEFG